MKTNIILQGDALTVLRTLPDESVQCVITSPPYYGLRDYGVDGQIGLEETPEQFVENLVKVFHEVRRVLRKDGTLWLNLGDSYAGSGRGRDADGSYNEKNFDTSKQATNRGSIAGRLMNNKATRPSFRRDGAEVVPRKVNDKSFSKNLIEQGAIGNAWVKPPAGYKAKDLMGIPWRVAFALQADGWYLRQDIIWHKPNPMPESVMDRCTKSHEYIFLLAKSDRYYYDAAAIKDPWVQRPNDIKRGLEGSPKYNGKHKDGYNGNTTDGGVVGDPNAGANKRSVWSVTTAPFKGAHFATFPEKLVEPMVMAGCPEGGAILDPFFGAGTTGLVAKKLGRKYIGIELNPEYAKIAEDRINTLPDSLFDSVIPSDGSLSPVGSV